MNEALRVNTFFSNFHLCVYDLSYHFVLGEEPQREIDA